MNLGGVVHLNKTSITIFCGVLLIVLLLSMVSLNKNDDIIHSVVEENDNINLYNLIKVAIRAAENGGIEVVGNKDNITIKKKGLTKEGQVDSVTTADFLSHCSILKTLKHFYSSLRIISEEAKTTCNVNQKFNKSLPNLATQMSDELVEKKDITVWIDPLDATHEYTEKLYNYVTVMVCVAIKGKPVIGVIHQPFSKTTSWAWVNKARSKDLNQQVFENSDFTKIIISRSHKGKIEETLHKNFNKKINLITAAGAGYKTLEVAKGNVDAYLHITAIKKWDICAGNAVINSLGGQMTTKYNKEIDYSSDSDVINENGLIVTMKNHDMYLGKL